MERARASSDAEDGGTTTTTTTTTTTSDARAATTTRAPTGAFFESRAWTTPAVAAETNGGGGVVDARALEDVDRARAPVDFRFLEARTRDAGETRDARADARERALMKGRGALECARSDRSACARCGETSTSQWRVMSARYASAWCAAGDLLCNKCYAKARRFARAEEGAARETR
ncbi:unnamed product [Ostreococcus tauri]|uniref:Unnamed product n=1 Tax=Ostreococcus tauri TaxID=70448 RepID=A0A090M7Q8_OSTTA|nr:unnamed product [Ostreococcus tauri]OUS47757.1 hypothetical protein BE221DRAFT_69928 [Ostreococcus tauri]CEF98154.1 unnamed product [Ostreococcus tauri]|eukprot:XP_022839110.1 unnamed product [Ostreococcus tauri]